MRHRTVVQETCALLVALSVLAGCGDRPEVARPAGSEGEAAARDTAGGVPLKWVRLPEEEAARLGAQIIMLGRSPAPGVTSPPSTPDGEGGILHHGAIRMGESGREGAGGTDVFVAVLETSRQEGAAEGPPWLLYVDRDLDGDLSEERPAPAAARAAGESPVELMAARFPVVETLGPMGGVHAFLMVALVTRDDEGRTSAVLRSHTACALSGSVEMFGAERDVVVYDSDANGVFGDLARSVDRAGDVIWIDFDSDGTRAEGESLFLARRLVHKGKVASVAIQPETRHISVTDLDVPTGRIGPKGADAAEKVAVQLYADEYGLVAPGPAALVPAGRYTLVRYAIRRDDVFDGSKWLLAGGWLTGSAPEVEVKPGETTEVAFGPPVEARAWVRYDLAAAGAEGVLIVVSLRGAAGETLRLGFEADGKEKPADWGEFRILDGEKEIGGGKLSPSPGMPGAGMAVWKPDPALGEIERGRRLVLDVAPDVGPFKEGFRGRQAFEYGKPTPIKLVVSEVEPGTQAESVGVRPGDAVLRYDSKVVEGPVDLMRAMKAAARKSRVELVVLRGGREVAFDLLPGKIGIMTALTLP